MKHPSAIAAFGAGCLFALALSPPAAAADSVDLVGTWYVLVHYKDDASTNPDLERWEDTVWVFQKKGSRIRWTKYPIVVFEDESGRFERRQSGQYARVLHYWEPSPRQRADIADGLQVNQRGAKKKTLRGSDAKGWKSGRPSQMASASVVTYSELWSVEGMPTRPVFARSDFMSGANTDDMEGLTQYATSEVSDGGNTLVGSFQRDGHRRGTFRMTRSGAVGALAKKTQSELQQQGALRSLQTNPEARAEAQKAVEAQLEGDAVVLSTDDMEQVSSLALRLFLEQKPQAEINRQISERLGQITYGFAAVGAKHDDSVRYHWPFDDSVPRQLLQGVSSEPTQSRADSTKHTFHFELPAGSEVRAARDGVVRRIVDGSREGGPQRGMAWKANAVWISHADGSIAAYSHLESGIDVEVGQKVEVGTPLGKSGSTGQTSQPELGFQVLVVDTEEKPRGVRIAFDDGTGEGVVPVVGRSYGGK